MRATFEHSFRRRDPLVLSALWEILYLFENVWKPLGPRPGPLRGFLKTLWFEEENMTFPKGGGRKTFLQNSLFLALPQL